MRITKEQFKFALNTEGVLKERSLELLNIMFYAPNCLVDGYQIAEMMGYSDFPPVNALIGKLGKRIADVLSIEIEREEYSPGWYRIVTDGEFRSFAISG